MRRFLPSVFLFILALFLGIYFRLYPATHNQRLLELDNARIIAYVNISKNIQRQLKNNYPDLSEAQRRALEIKFLKEIPPEQKRHIDDQVRRIAAENKSDSFRETYLLEADPYYYLGLTESILKSGNIGGERKGAKYFNPLMTAPNGCWYNFDLHPYVGFYIFKLLSLIRNDISPEFSAAVTPLILFIPTLFMVLWLYKVLKLKPVSAWFGLIYFACLPILIMRGSFGWYDTDIYNVIFPLLVITVLMRSLSADTDFKGAIGLNILAAFLTALYSLFWRGWIYLPLFVISAYLVVIIFNALKQDKSLNAHFAVYVVATILFGVLFIGVAGLRDTLSEYARIIRSFFGAEAQIWPDVYITIGEMKRVVFSKTIGLFGGIFAVLLALLGFLSRLASLFTNRDDTSERRKTLFLCVISILLFVFSMSAERFLIFSSIPLAIFFAFGVETLTVKKHLSAVIAILLCLMIIPELLLAHANASQQFPIMNRYWKEALLEIRDSTPKEAIINSWWCPGHFITAISKRRVTFDGATQYAPLEYWVANAFLSEDENRSMGIWRMLNTSGNAAFDFLTADKKHKPSEAVKILNSILPLSRQRAKILLSGSMSQEDADSLLNLTHGNSPPSCCLIYDNLIETIIGLRYFGNWDLKKIEDFNMPAKRGSPEYKDFLWSISGGEGYIGEESYEVERRGKTVFFGNGVSLNTENMDCDISLPGKNVKAKPASVFYMDGEVFKEKKFDNTSGNISVLVINYADKFSCLVADRQFAASLLMRLYYFKGKGLKFFRNFCNVEDPVTRTRVFVYGMDWEAFNEKDDRR